MNKELFASYPLIDHGLLDYAPWIGKNKVREKNICAKC